MSLYSFKKKQPKPKKACQPHRNHNIIMQPFKQPVMKAYKAVEVDPTFNPYLRHLPALGKDVPTRESVLRDFKGRSFNGSKLLDKMSLVSVYYRRKHGKVTYCVAVVDSTVLAKVIGCSHKYIKTIITMARSAIQRPTSKMFIDDIRRRGGASIKTYVYKTYMLDEGFSVVSSSILHDLKKYNHATEDVNLWLQECSDQLTKMTDFIAKLPARSSRSSINNRKPSNKKHHRQVNPKK